MLPQSVRDIVIIVEHLGPGAKPCTATNRLYLRGGVEQQQLQLARELRRVVDTRLL